VFVNVFPLNDGFAETDNAIGVLEVLIIELLSIVGFEEYCAQIP